MLNIKTKHETPRYCISLTFSDSLLKKQYVVRIQVKQNKVKHLL